MHDIQGWGVGSSAIFGAGELRVRLPNNFGD